MSSHNKSPFRNGSKLGAAFSYIQKKQVVTRKEMLTQFNSFVTNIILSPREEGKCKGDCRGNPATYGGKYFMQKLADKKLRLRWRKTELPPVRQSVKKVQAIKKPVTQKTPVNA